MNCFRVRVSFNLCFFPIRLFNFVNELFEKLNHQLLHNLHFMCLLCLYSAISLFNRTTDTKSSFRKEYIDTKSNQSFRYFYSMNLKKFHIWWRR